MARSGPLAGVRVVEMGQLIAVPFAMKLLADMGAQVIRLESTRRLESYRSDSVYLNEVDGAFWDRGANSTSKTATSWASLWSSTIPEEWKFYDG